MPETPTIETPTTDELPDFDAIGEAFASTWLGPHLQAQADDTPAGDDDQGGSGTDESTAPPPGDEADATADGADAPAALPAEGADAGDEGATTGEPSIAHLAVPLPDGSTFDLDADTASRLLGLSAWANQLPEDMRTAFAAIEQGAAVAIPRSEYEQFQAWRQTRGTQAPADPYASLEDAGVEPEVIAQLRARDARLAELEAAANQPGPQHMQQAQGVFDDHVARFEAGVNEWAQQHGITDQALIDSLSETAVRAGVIPSFIERGRQFSPTGTVVREADLSDVAKQAMTYALALDPQLHTQVLTRLAAGSEPTPPPSPTPDTVASKKARAASVALAPSASVPLPPSDPRTFTPQQQIHAMAAELEQRMNGGG